MAMGATLLYNRKVILLVKLLLVKVLLVIVLLVKVYMAHNGYEDEFPLVVLHQLEACGGNLGRILLFLETCFLLSDPSPVTVYPCHSLTHRLSCLADLTDVNLAFEDAN